MATIRLPNDFRELLQLFNSNHVEYLLIGGYAVNYYGYARSTGDMDIWVRRSPENAVNISRALQAFGFSDAYPELFTLPDQLIRIGVPPLRVEILTSISGVQFDECYENRERVEIDGTELPLIQLEDLKRNKRATGRLKDLADLEQLD
jgi:predicted nucleotidyltransferase